MTIRPSRIVLMSPTADLVSSVSNAVPGPAGMVLHVSAMPLRSGHARR